MAVDKQLDGQLAPRSPSKATVRRQPSLVWSPDKEEPSHNAFRKEEAFLNKVRDTTGFCLALRRAEQEFSLPLPSIEKLAEEISRCCWVEANEVLGSEGALGEALGEVAELKHRLMKMHASSMKQINAAKQHGHEENEYAQDRITFHEPLHYLDEDTKDLVLCLVCEKFRLLSNGMELAPPSLVAALEKHLRHCEVECRKERGGGGGGANLEELVETRAELDKAEAEVRSLGRQLEEAKNQSKMAVIRLEEATRSLEEARKKEAAMQAAHKQLQEEHKELQEVAIALRVEYQKLQDVHSALQNEHQTLRQQHDTLKLEYAALEKASKEAFEKVERLEEELRQEKEANEQLQTKIKKIEESMATVRQQLADCKARCAELEEELRRRNNTRTSGTQTDLTGETLDKQAAEARRLRLTIEELQMKLKELLEKARKKGMGAQVKELAAEVGLDEVLEEKTVWERLYKDAERRLERLDRLREQYREKRKKLQPWEAPHEPAEPSWEKLETSPLPPAMQLVAQLAERHLQESSASRSASEPLCTCVAFCESVHLSALGAQRDGWCPGTSRRWISCQQ
eukprot:TRINITY_DN38255_c0_g3_i1.p1 TRINITY_DN38255_c0_g3~~TRINITY_DN38255_c0_g3_i1.p1  ORF type:complete len:571 (-),score=211.34 TRINITY_DN38255_c0_g3_i1:166-1878(-)